MKPEEINLQTTRKLFAYEKMSREIDAINDINTLKDVAKSYAKLYMKQQEVILKL